jgi:regulator of protease activity HflC (stomatin/prohibitin superfamily)
MTPGVKLNKRALECSLQKFTKFPITPLNYALQLQVTDMLSVSLVVKLTIGPDTDEALTNHVILTTNAGGKAQDIVGGIIEDKTRSIVSTMSMDEPLYEQKHFREKVLRNVQDGLDQFGLKVYNVNVHRFRTRRSSKRRVPMQLSSVNRLKKLRRCWCETRL